MGPMGTRKRRTGGLVYSSEHGAVCPGCGHPLSACACSRASPAPTTPDRGVLVRRESKGRKGKEVTLVTGVPLAPGELSELGQTLKKKCGSGGTVKDGVIEIQGDHRDRVVEVLEGRGFKVRRA